MKKMMLFSMAGAMVLALAFVACQKETQPEISQIASENPASDRFEVENPCRQTTVYWTQLAAKRPISTSAFQGNWKSGELDRLANDCVFRNELPNCSEPGGGVAIFYGLPQFDLFNFMSNPPYVTPAEQMQIINAAIAYAQSHITGCGPNASPKVYQMDFTVFPSGPFFGEEIQFAARYACCPSSSEVR